jgi:hypothetical protein
MFGDWKWKGLSAVRERRLLATWVDSIEQAGGRAAGASKALFTARFFSKHHGPTESNTPVHLLTGWASSSNSQSQVCWVHLEHCSKV